MAPIDLVTVVKPEECFPSDTLFKALGIALVPSRVTEKNHRGIKLPNENVVQRKYNVEVLHGKFSYTSDEMNFSTGILEYEEDNLTELFIEIVSLIFNNHEMLIITKYFEMSFFQWLFQKQYWER